MQNRKSVWAVLVLLWALTLFFATLPLYANSIDPGANANSGISPDGGVSIVDKATIDDGVTTDEQLPDGYNTTIPGQNTTPDTKPHDGTHTNGNDHGTLGDKDGDGRIGRSVTDVSADTTADHAEQGGFSWGWLLFILLLAAVVIVILLLCMPRRG